MKLDELKSSLVTDFDIWQTAASSNIKFIFLLF